MPIYKNPNCMKVRGSHILEVSCAYCKQFIAKYQKVGETGFVKMYNEGIIDFSLLVSITDRAEALSHSSNLR